MKKQLETLRDAIDQSATDYMKSRVAAGGVLSDRDNEVFGFIKSAKKQLDHAIIIMERQQNV